MHLEDLSRWLARPSFLRRSARSNEAVIEQELQRSIQICSMRETCTQAVLELSFRDLGRARPVDPIENRLRSVQRRICTCDPEGRKGMLDRVASDLDRLLDCRDFDPSIDRLCLAARS